MGRYSDTVITYCITQFFYTWKSITDCRVLIVKSCWAVHTGFILAIDPNMTVIDKLLSICTLRQLSTELLFYSVGASGSDPTLLQTCVAGLLKCDTGLCLLYPHSSAFIQEYAIVLSFDKLFNSRLDVNTYIVNRPASCCIATAVSLL